MSNIGERAEDISNFEKFKTQQKAVEEKLNHIEGELETANGLRKVEIINSHREDLQKIIHGEYLKGEGLLSPKGSLRSRIFQNQMHKFSSNVETREWRAKKTKREVDRELAYDVEKKKILEKGLELSQRAMKILPPSPTQESLVHYSEAVSEYKEAVKKKVTAEDKIQRAQYALDNLLPGQVNGVGPANRVSLSRDLINAQQELARAVQEQDQKKDIVRDALYEVSKGLNFQDIKDKIQEARNALEKSVNENQSPDDKKRKEATLEQYTKLENVLLRYQTLARYQIEGLTEEEQKVGEDIENFKFSIRLFGTWFNSEIANLKNSFDKQLDETQKNSLTEEVDEDLKIFNTLLKTTEELENIDKLDRVIENLRVYKKHNDNLAFAAITVVVISIFIYISLVVLYGIYKPGEAIAAELDFMKKMLQELP